MEQAKEIPNQKIYLTSELLSGVKHGFFTRNGGVSTGTLASLNCSFQSGDPKETVSKNRGILSKSLGHELGDLKTLKQVHSNKVYVVKEVGDLTNEIEADALVTGISSILLGVQTADCTPILFIDSNTGIIGAAHAGWKGALGGIIQNTVQEMEKLGGARKDIKAMIGPTIAQKSYEVDSSFREKFLNQSKENKKYFIGSVKSGHYMFDLPGYCYEVLQSEGIDQVDNLGIDTYSNPDKFFSCRRAAHKGEKGFGGQLSVIGLI